MTRLGFVHCARELAFTLDDVRALLGLAAGSEAACADVRELAATAPSLRNMSDWKQI